MTGLLAMTVRTCRSVIRGALSCAVMAGHTTVGAQIAPYPASRVPSVTGPFAVGRMEFHWIDSSRTEPFLASLSARREVVVFVWYPAAAHSGAHEAAYIPHYASMARALGDSAMNSEFGRLRQEIASGAIRSHSLESAPLLAIGRPFPVLIFSPGFDESVLTYSAQVEDLASHGYVVLGLEHPFDAYAVWLADDHVVPFPAALWHAAQARPNGAYEYQLAQLALRADDIRFVLDRLGRIATVPGAARFAGALDLTRVGAFGHSLGGVAAADACRFDARIRACMNEDADAEGRPFSGGPAAFPIKQPFLFFVTGHSIYASARTPSPSDSALVGMKITRAAYDSINTLYQRNQDAALAAMPGGAIRIMAEAKDFTHGSFIDMKLLRAPDSAAARTQLEYLRVIRLYTRAFFDSTLRGMPAGPLGRQGVIDSLVTIDGYR